MPVIDTIVSATPISDNDNYLSKSTDKLKNALQEIADLKQWLNEAKEALPQLVVDCLSDAPTRDEADALAWEIYWNFDDIPTTPLSTFYRMPISYVRDIIGGVTTTVYCRNCGKSEKQSFTSRSAYKDAIGDSYRSFECGECKEKRSHESVIRQAEYQKAIAEEQRQLTLLKTMPYRDYLQTDHWKEIRMVMLKRARFSCQLCSAKGELHVHHRTYENRGNEQYSDLIVLCADCHGKFHDKLVG